MKKACVIGWPIEHSRSPLIHNYWIKKHGIDAAYEKKPVAPQDLSGFIRSLAASAFVGCNVTIPHKEAAFGEVAVADEVAARVGAVNTVYVRNNRVCGTNTDGEGFVASLRQSSPAFSLRNRLVVLLGAGGAAKAIVGGLLDEGAEKIGVINRTRGKIHALEKQFGPRVFTIEGSAVADELRSCGLLVNTTSQGMEGQPPLELDIQSLNPQALVADIVYTPLETALLKNAKAQGNPTMGGLGMLLHQAVRGFELWFGVRPEVTPELHELVAADVRKSAAQ